MDKDKSLYRSIVGASVRYKYGRFSDKEVVTMNDIIPKEINKIEKDVEIALGQRGVVCVMVLAELTNYYRKQTYYMQLRGYIKRKRYAPDILEYLELSLDDRQKRMEKIMNSRNREAVLIAIKYFTMTYPNRLENFREILTRSEYIEIQI